LRPANELNGQAPEAIAAALTRALAQLPDERPATATEMRRALRAAVKPPDYYDTATSTDGSWVESDLLNVGLTTASLGAMESSVTEATNAGRIVAPSSALGVDKRGAAFAWLRPGGAWAAGVVLSLLLPVIAALAYWSLNPSSGSSAANPPGRAAAITVTGSSTPAPRPFVEAMRYYLDVESETGRAKRVAGDNPLDRRRWLKFHFTPSRGGYLYIIAPGERAARVTFLTAQPNSTWGVKGNRLEAGTEYSFPPRPDKWIEVARGASIRTYTIIFTPEPLVRPRFLAGPANHSLTAAEKIELAELQMQYGQGAPVKQGAQYIVKIPAEAPGAPFLFEFNLPIWADKEGGQR
jgi:hypothetical protein